MTATGDAIIGGRIRELRERAGRSQAEVSEALGRLGATGFYPQTIAKLEAGSRSLRFHEAVKLAAVLDVPLTDLHFPPSLNEEEDEMNEWPRSWTHTVGREVARLRDETSMSAQALADCCAELGYPINRGTIAKFENGRRESIGVHELVVLARALEVDPLDLLFPDCTTVEPLPGRALPAEAARVEFVGEQTPQDALLDQAITSLRGAERSLRLISHGRTDGQGAAS